MMYLLVCACAVCAPWSMTSNANENFKWPKLTPILTAYTQAAVHICFVIITIVIILGSASVYFSFFLLVWFSNTTWQQTQFSLITIHYLLFASRVFSNNSRMYRFLRVCCCNTRHNCVRRLFIFHTINISTETNKFSRVDVLRLLSVLTVNLKRILLCCCCCPHCRQRQSTENVGEC